MGVSCHGVDLMPDGRINAVVTASPDESLTELLLHPQKSTWQVAGYETLNLHGRGFVAACKYSFCGRYSAAVEGRAKVREIPFDHKWSLPIGMCVQEEFVANIQALFGS